MAQSVPTIQTAGGALVDSRRRIGVIDIGSNSIRLVVFTGSERAPLPVFNEKVMCGMGRRLHSTSRLDPDGVELALENLPRFAAAAEALGTSKLRVVATAAIRDAADGAIFIQRVKQVSGLAVETISGEAEARFSALGLLSALPEADGAMGDLGGGSLELVRLDRGNIGQQVTLPLGPLRLNEAAREGTNVGKVIKETLAGLPWLPGIAGKSFYAIGGAWRTLARIHQAHTNYKLRVIDNYRVNARAFRDFAQLLGKMSDAALKQMPNVPAKRLDALRPAARILRHVLGFGGARDVVFSAQGLREGIIFDDLSEARRRDDPMLASATDVGRMLGRYPRMGPALTQWTDGLFKGESRQRRRLRETACLIADMGWIDHPDYRGSLAYERALSLPLPGLDHPGRAFLSLALYARYEEDSAPKQVKLAVGIGLSDTEINDARALGQAIRLGYTLAAGRDDTLLKTSLGVGEKLLVLSVPRVDGIYAGESVTKRLEELALTLNVTMRIAVRAA